MILSAVHSHRGGLEIMENSRPRLWERIQEALAALDAEKARQKVSKRSGELLGRLIYNHHYLAQTLGESFRLLGGQEITLDYWSGQDPAAVAASLELPPGDRRAYLEKSGQVPVTGTIGGLVAQEVGLEAPFAKTPVVAQDLWLKFPALHRAGLIELGVEFLPLAAWQTQMVAGLATYEEMLFHLAVQGSEHPPVPLLLVGLIP